ncbi:hypothetical protein CCR80_02370 [Rhodothalassium salexigens]|uniref:ATP phosphoribosyltransferase regulatory subunit n=1 Tax=Rhodothalassium salexigens TaxID=1086 RepID=UPI0019123C96|nr:ATP phosphoribosyltransferase regulatory subunit [Rhodothalassium salexigens]MBK5919881.1 hypothetical protein [Rhodothalassium salexigens]
MTAERPPFAPGPGARGLLPEGFRDLMPPWAEHEARLTDRLTATFAAHGYERVSPPLVEFEDSLAGAGFAGAPAGRLSAGAAPMFRLLDPASNRMMAVRSDMTLQIARLAATRLADRPRPLRLSYAGHVMRVRGSQLRPQRQFRQAGVELIGAEGREAELEVIALAVEAAETAGLDGLSLDLTMVGFVPALARGLGLDAAAAETLTAALDTKDVGALDGLGETARGLGRGVLEAAGLAEPALARLLSLDLPDEAARLARDLADLAGRIAADVPGVALTVDPGETRGFHYKRGAAFSLFAHGVRGALCRGGRYRTGGADAAGTDRGPGGEPAVGFSLYLDTMLQGLAPPAPAETVYVPAGTPRAEAATLRGAGWRTVNGLAKPGDPVEEARRLQCSHVLTDRGPVPVSTAG